MSLTDLDRAILDFAKRRYRFEGQREQAIRDEFGMTSTAFTQRLVRLLSDPDAAVAEPALVRRLRSVRDQRLGQKAARRTA